MREKVANKMKNDCREKSKNLLCSVFSLWKWIWRILCRIWDYRYGLSILYPRYNGTMCVPSPCMNNILICSFLRTILVFALVCHSLCHSQSSQCLVTKRKGKRPCQFNFFPWIKLNEHIIGGDTPCFTFNPGIGGKISTDSFQTNFIFSWLTSNISEGGEGEEDKVPKQNTI